MWESGERTGPTNYSVTWEEQNGLESSDFTFKDSVVVTGGSDQTTFRDQAVLVDLPSPWLSLFSAIILSKPKAVNHGILLIMNDSSIFFLALRSVFRLLYTKLMYMCAHFDADTCLFTFVVKYYSYKLCIFRGCMYLNHTIFRDSHVQSCESMQRSVPMRMSIEKH